MVQPYLFVKTLAEKHIPNYQPYYLI